jgi:hypothetical protein
MDLPLVSVSLPSVPPSHWLPSFFRDVELALLLLVAYFTDLVTAVMHGGRGKGSATEGGREGGREEGTRQHTRCLRISGPAAAAVAIADQLISCRRRRNPGLGNDENLMLLPSPSSDLLLLLADE